jgi:hypothetical protein
MAQRDVATAPASHEEAPEGGSDESPRRDWLAGRAWSRSDLLVAVLVALAVVALALAYRSIVVPTDPWRYVRSAANFPDDDWVPLGYTRYGIVLASGLPALLFGNSQITYYFWPLLSAGVLCACIYLLGRRWWGAIAGVVAVLLFLSNTVVFYNLSRGYPDIMSMAIFTLAVVLALLVRDRPVWDRWATLLTLGVGFLLGWGFEVRETSMMAWPLIAVILWRRGRLVRSALLLLAPLLAWAALDVGISALAYGDPLLKVRVLTGTDISATRTATGELAQANLVNQPRWSYFTFIPRRAWAREDDGVAMVLVWALALLGLVVRNGAARLMAGWFVGVYLVTVLAAGGLDPAHPRGRLDITRYWIPWQPAAALAVAGVVAIAAAALARRLGGNGRSRALRLGLTTALAAVVCALPVSDAVRYAHVSTAFPPAGGDALEQLRADLAAKDFTAGAVWTDWSTARILPAYMRPMFGGDKVWDAERVRNIAVDGVEPASGDYVLLFRPGSLTCGFCLNALDPWTRAHPDGPPASWRPVFTSDTDNLVLYEVTQ